MKRILFIILACSILFAGCGKKEKIDEAEMRKLASSLTKLASAVEATVRNCLCSQQSMIPESLHRFKITR